MKKLFQALFTTLTLALTQTVAAQAPDTTVNGLNTFAFDLYNKVNTSGQNTVFSPYSLSSLLGILTTGSAGSTHAQLLKVLHLNNSNDIDGLNSRLDQINTALTQQKCSGNAKCDDQAVIIGNALWAENTFTYKPAFLTAMQQLHTMDFFRVDFAQSPDQATSKINGWVATKTKGYITNLIGRIPSGTRLILTNAIYFKGLWSLPFDAQETRQQSFYPENGKTIQVPMMNREGNFAYTDNDKLQMLVLNYNNSSLSMAIILPKTKHLQDVQQALNQSVFSQLVQSADDTDVILSMPKFKIESTFDSLSDDVAALGLTDAFGAKANFSNMTNDKLFISTIIQKALIQVDEKGTVAAAATGIMMATAIENPVKPVNFTVDHPFIFVIFDAKSGLILFMGQVVNPLG